VDKLKPLSLKLKPLRSKKCITSKKNASTRHVRQAPPTAVSSSFDLSDALEALFEFDD
jgi:hypothetical protein